MKLIQRCRNNHARYHRLTACASPLTLQSRSIRLLPVNFDQEAALAPATVMFTNISNRGGTRRFYRQVHIKPLSEVIDQFDLSLDTEQNEGWCLTLDHRILVIQGSPIVFDHYKFALLAACEWESQAEYIRTESMPITDISVLKILRDRDQGFAEFRRGGHMEIAKERIQRDLLRVAESKELHDEGYYETHWRPILDWFNLNFEANIEIDYVDFVPEESDPSEINLDIKSMDGMSAAEFMEMYENTQMYKKLLNRPKRNDNLKLLFRFLDGLDPDRLWCVDYLIRWTDSTILSTALVCNAVTVDAALKAMHVPDLDLGFLDREWDDDMSIKASDSYTQVAATRLWLDIYDELHPPTFREQLKYLS